ncbi:dihydroorotase [Paraburkholderia silvatlantica]|uniref:dihydroorotase n=1 Tax=Paraburkholderia silvatlantica TaxID=321895 RepID=UPI00105EFECB|nr:dihydroorotase [Paraburkholderia silvatlantica]TDQ92254.1 dihydroorotase [Paraburkholderia silvatlantica]
MVQSVTLRRPDDFHLHLRDDAMLRTVLPYSVRQFGRAVVMPNLKPPVTTVAAARAYRERILQALPSGSTFEPLMTCYLCDGTDPAEISAGFEGHVFTAAKLYPAGATTHSEYGVTAIDKIAKVLDVMQKLGMPLLIHGESTDPGIDVFDKEAVFLDRTLKPLLEMFPALKVVLEHITTEQAANFVDADTSGRLAATITPQHLLFNRNAMFTGGLRPHYYCLPVLKREQDRTALRRVATSGSRSFFLGTDSAPHERGTKEAACGCAGIFSAPTALEAYLSVFDEEHALERFEAFASESGRLFYDLPPNEGTVTLTRERNDAPRSVALGDGKSIETFMGDGELSWRLVDHSST